MVFAASLVAHPMYRGQFSSPTIAQRILLGPSRAKRSKARNHGVVGIAAGYQQSSSTIQNSLFTTYRCQQVLGQLVGADHRCMCQCHRAQPSTMSASPGRAYGSGCHCRRQRSVAAVARAAKAQSVFGNSNIVLLPS